MAEYKFLEERTAAEKRFPFIRQFRDKVNIAPTKTENKGGYGEYVEADSPDNPMPGKPTITIGRNSGRKLQKEVVNNLSGNSLALAKRRYENDFKGKFSGSNFSTFDNFLKGYWADGIVQHLLLPENSEIDQIKRSSPKAIPALNAIEELFKTGVPPGKIIGDVLDE